MTTTTRTPSVTILRTASVDGIDCDVARVTARCRSLGFGWTTQPLRDRAEIAPVSGPDVVGGLRSVDTERARHQRAVSGGVWSRTALWVGGRRVIGTGTDVQVALAELREAGETIVYLRRED